MDRLVKVSTNELELTFIPNQRCSTTFQLTNLMHTMSVAVSLTTTTTTVTAAGDPPSPPPQLFTVTQPLSILSPLSTSTYTLSLSRPSDHPPLSSPPPSLLVRTAVLPTGKAHHQHLRRLFSAPGLHIFRDASLPISLLGPHVAQFLLSSSNSPNFLFSKAISRCPVSDLKSLLFSAVLSSADPSLVFELIRAGADVNAREKDDGESLISIAVSLGSVGVVKALIESGCDVGSEDLLMHRAAEMNRVDLMEVLGCGWDSVDSNGRSPVHVSANCGHFDALKLCVSMGGDPDRVDFNGCTPLHCAAEYGVIECVEFLLDCSLYSKYVMSKDGRTPFLVAIDNGHSHLLDLLRLGDVLHRAATVGDGHGLENCVSQGAKVNGKDQNGWTPLHRAAFKGQLEIVKSLIGHGAQIDLVDDVGYTPLHCAIEAGRVQVAMYLIAHGARPNLKSIKGVCPLKLEFQKNHPVFVSPLCKEIEQALRIES